MSTVLLVDDDFDNPWALQLALESVGHHVVLAENGRDALQKARHCNPQLVITDWQMPEMDGTELCRRLRCQPMLSDIPIILLSAMDKPQSASLYCSAFLRKPAPIEHLLSTVNHFIARRLSVQQTMRSCKEGLPSRWRAIDPRCWP
ncbi:response regulator [Paraburkholderia sp. UYCP14C]|uniref:response regulator n=1 Tax=Paraburkholderia sp. UYCP14C TaxID=2511130 RepID=UPI0010225698|nr:response regulator [Paraburkholderia sp. UYCP14C]RZF26494.1 response regulator [Paraburkholderia sp. UYCP14C]